MEEQEVIHLMWSWRNGLHEFYHSQCLLSFGPGQSLQADAISTTFAQERARCGASKGHHRGQEALLPKKYTGSQAGESNQIQVLHAVKQVYPLKSQK